MNIIEMKNITKTFPGTVAVDGVNFKLRQGEILSLLGENGAGKTTLMKVLYGMHSMDSGEIYFRGRPVRISKPADAIALGICMVHQHFMLVGAFTVADNIIVGSEPGGAVFIDQKRAYAEVEELIRQFNFKLDPKAKVSSLSVGEQQRVEILKALYRKAQVLILDEPTAVLTPREVDDLFVVLDKLRAEGRSIVIITHKLKETKAIADRVMVLRDSRMIQDDVNPAAATFSELSDMMVGRHVELGTIRRTACAGEPLLRIEHLCMEEKGRKLLDDICLEVRGGEILGIAGIEGNGQTQLLEAVTGLCKPQSMHLTIGDADVAGGADVFLRRGMAHIPEDRNAMGLVGTLPIRDNFILGYESTSEFSNKSFLRKKLIARKSEVLLKEFLIKAPNAQTTVGALSGGNAQKVIIARALSQKPTVLIVAQPTRGVDVGAAEYIRERIRQLRDEGSAVLLVSADLDEVMQLSDRVAVIYEGRIVCQTAADKYTDVQLGMLMTGTPVEDLGGGTRVGTN